MLNSTYLYLLSSKHFFGNQENRKLQIAPHVVCFSSKLRLTWCFCKKYFFYIGFSVSGQFKRPWIVHSTYQKKGKTSIHCLKPISFTLSMILSCCIYHLSAWEYLCKRRLLFRTLLGLIFLGLILDF